MGTGSRCKHRNLFFACAFVAPAKSANLLTEDAERVLIQFGHFPTTLKDQPGRFHSSLLPHAVHAQLFRQLCTSVLLRFSQHQTILGREPNNELIVNFEVVQVYANDSPDETGTVLRSFNDGLREMMQRQATPAQFSVSTLMLVIGKDITRTDYLAQTSFIAGKSRAGVPTKEILGRIATSEAQSQGRGSAFIALQADNPLRLFNDLWPWLWHINILQAIIFM